MNSNELVAQLGFFRDIGVETLSIQPQTAEMHSQPQKRHEDQQEIMPSKLSNLESIRAEIGDCQRCKLAPKRKNIVFGAGDPKAELVFVGEAPGSDEDEQGMPFVGRAGQLLTKIIESISLKREDVYICNVLKCRPPENRNPEPDEVAACNPFLKKQLATIRPKVVCCLGTFAAQTVLQTTSPISKLRGRFFDLDGIRVIAIPLAIA